MGETKELFFHISVLYNISQHFLVKQSRLTSQGKGKDREWLRGLFTFPSFFFFSPVLKHESEKVKCLWLGKSALIQLLKQIVEVLAFTLDIEPHCSMTVIWKFRFQSKCVWLILLWWLFVCLFLWVKTDVTLAWKGFEQFECLFTWHISFS